MLSFKSSYLLNILNVHMKKDKLFTRSFLNLTVSNFVMAIAFYFITPIMALFMVDTMDAGNDQVGIVMFSFSIAAIIIRPFAGYLLDSHNRYRLYLASFILFTSSFLGYPFASTFMFLLFLRFYHGVTWGAVSTASNTLAVDLIAESRRGEGIGVFGLSMTIAMAIGPAMAMSMSQKVGYTAIFYTAVLFCVVGFLLALFIKAPHTRRERKPLSLGALIDKSTLPIGANVLMTQIPYGGVISFAALYGREIGVMNSSLFFVILSIGILFSRVVSGRLFDRIGPRVVMITGILSVSVALLVLGNFATPAGFFVSAIILGIGFGIIAPTFQAMANDKVEPLRRGAVNSTYLTFFDTGVGIGMLLFGILFESMGYANTFYFVAGLQLAALLFFVTQSLPNYYKRVNNN